MELKQGFFHCSRSNSFFPCRDRNQPSFTFSPEHRRTIITLEMWTSYPFCHHCGFSWPPLILVITRSEKDSVWMNDDVACVGGLTTENHRVCSTNEVSSRLFYLWTLYYFCEFFPGIVYNFRFDIFSDEYLGILLETKYYNVLFRVMNSWFPRYDFMRIFKNCLELSWGAFGINVEFLLAICSPSRAYRLI